MLEMPICKRLAVVAPLGACLVLAGCLTSQGPAFPPDQDPDQLVAAIAERSRDSGHIQSQPPDSSFTLGDGMKVGVAVCGLIALLPLYIVYNSLPRGSGVPEGDLGLRLH
jgi:hypothetical protein